MKAWWKIQAARIDALSLRERGFLFVSLLCIGLALVDVLWLTPAQVELQQARERSGAQTVELQNLRAEMQTLSQPVDASKAVRDELAAAQARLEAINEDINTRIPTADSKLALEKVLVQFLRRQDGLTLISTGTFKETKAAPTAAAPAPVTAGLQKRGLELKVAGSYAELTRYVKTLENALPTLRWSDLQLNSEKPVPELTLQVYVVGVQP